jgi:hypothetical protein
MMTELADMLVARTLSPRSCTAILASASSRDRGITFSLAYMRGSNCFAMLATFATSGISVVFHGCSSTQLRMTVAMVMTTLRRVRVNMPMPFANVLMVSSIGAVRNSVSPLMAKRTTASVSTGTPSAGGYVQPSMVLGSPSWCDRVISSAGSSLTSSIGLCMREAMFSVA